MLTNILHLKFNQSVTIQYYQTLILKVLFRQEIKRKCNKLFNKIK